MTDVLLPPAVVTAARTQARHRADEDGDCAFCWLSYRDEIQAGWCKPYLRAARFIRAYRQERRRPVPLPLVTFSGRRMWSSD